MSTGASQQGTGGSGSDDVNGVAPLAEDRPYVDGSAVSAEDLRAELERLSSEERQHLDDLREEVGDSVAELAARFDVKARVAERKESAVASAHQNLDRARHVAADGVASAKNVAAEKPGLAAGVAAALLVLLVVVLRRRRRG